MKKGLLILAAVFLLLSPLVAGAQEPSDSLVRVILASPPNSPIIDREIEKGELLEYEIKIKNELGGKAGIYALVYDIDQSGNLVPYNDPSELDRGTSLARWVDFRRAVIEIDQDQEVSQELKIRPAPEAEEGSYKAVIILSRGSTQIGAAESAEKYNEAKIYLNVKIKSHIIEKAEIAEFKPVTPILTASPLNFSLKIKNIGNRDISPKGEVVLYTKGGRELAAAPIESRVVKPGEVGSFPVKISFVGSPGRYKLKFLGEYGENSKELQDVIYVLYLPLVILSIIIIFVIGFLGWLAVLINKKRGGVHQMSESEGARKSYVINLKK